MLTEDHKRQRVMASREFFERYVREREDLFNSVVTGDEKLVYHFTPKTNLEGQHSDSPKKRKFQQICSWLRFFWDWISVLSVNFTPTGTTINGRPCRETLKILWRAIRSRRRGMLTKGVCLLQDNARPRVAYVTTITSRRYLAGTLWPILPIRSPDS